MPHKAVVRVATAWAGLVLGHLTAYLVAYPAAGGRQAHLLLTGHGSFGTLVLSLAAAIPLAVGLGIIGTLRDRQDEGWRTEAVWLASLQAPGFLLLEAVERHFSLASLWDPAVLVGIAVQVVVAVVAAVAIAAIQRGARAVAARRRKVLHPRKVVQLPATGVAIPRRRPGRNPVRRRAPPIPRAA